MTIADANKPKDLRGITGLKNIEKNAIEVVIDVNIMALNDRLKEYDIRGMVIRRRHYLWCY